MICINRKVVFIRSLKDFRKAFYEVHTTNTKKNKQGTANDETTGKSESVKPDPVFLSKETKVKAGIYEGSISFNVQTITRTNSPLLRYDYYKFIIDFIEKISHTNEMEEAQLAVFKLKNELEIVRQDKMKKEAELEQLHNKLSEFSLERSIQQEYSNDSTSINCLRLVAKESDLEDKKRLLVVNIKSINEKEQELFNEFLAAIGDSYDKEHLHSDFLKASIFTCSLLTFILTLMVMYIYNFNLIKKEKRFADKIRYLSEQVKMSNMTKNQQQESWGSYLKGYVRPLYSWAWPTK